MPIPDALLGSVTGVTPGAQCGSSVLPSASPARPLRKSAPDATGALERGREFTGYWLPELPPRLPPNECKREWV
jgi:hypothetical protein